MTAIDEYFPCRIEESKVKIQKLADEHKGLPESLLILIALKLLMEEQYRTGDRSEGWPSDEHNAMRFFLYEYIKEVTQ